MLLAGIQRLCSPARHSRESGNPAFAVLVFIKSKGFHSSFGRAGSFLCSCKERNQRNTPQRLAPDAHRARRVRVSGRVPLIAHPVQQRNRRDPLRRPLRGLIVRCRRKAMGPPGRAKARASCAQKREAKDKKRSSFCSCRCSALDPGPRQPRRGQAGKARRVARRDAREFANGQDAHRANPGLTLRTAEGSAAPGGHFFWLLFFVQAKKSDPLARMRAEKRRDAVRKNQEPEQRHWIPARSTRE